MVSFTLNDKRVSVDAKPDTPLLWIIRDHIGLTGTKYGCGAGMCGACTVHVDGKAVRSCQTQLSDAAGVAADGGTIVNPRRPRPTSRAPFSMGFRASCTNGSR